MSAKHRETKQYFTLYNTLGDTKQYLTKELSLLNSIYESYAEYVYSFSLEKFDPENLFKFLYFLPICRGMTNLHAKEQFVIQLEQIVDGVGQTKLKVRNKLEEEKGKRDTLNAQLTGLIEQQRKYAVVLKQFTKDCERNQILIKQLKAMQAAAKIKEIK